MENNITAEKKAELLAAIEQAQNALARFEELEELNEKTTDKAPTIEEALIDLDSAVSIVDDFIRSINENTDLLIA